MQAPDHITPLPATRDGNSILARVPSQFVGQAQISLPDPTLVPDDEISIEVHAGRPDGGESPLGGSGGDGLRPHCFTSPSRGSRRDSEGGSVPGSRGKCAITRCSTVRRAA